jgi:hypothetical protein
MKFTVSITDPAKLAGIAAAREAYNAALPDEFEDVPVEGGAEGETERKAIEPKPGTLATDDDYVQFVMDRAAESYAKQYQTGEAA